MKMQTIDELYSEALQLLKQLIATPSYSKEEQGTAMLLQKFFQAKGIVAHRLMNNLWATNLHFDKEKPTIVLNSHHDTVKPNAAYTLDPFCPIEKEGRLYGLGSNDAGGCLVSLIATFLYFCSQTDLRYNIVIAATAEEEISGANGIAALLPQLGEIAFGIVGEPTEMHMAIAEKGLVVLDCEVKGAPGHAARAEGDNAIYKALQDIEWFKEYQFEKVSEMLGAVKMSVTMLQAGTQHNVVPASCKFTVDVRVNDCYTNEDVVAIVQQHVQCETVPRSLRLRPTAIDIKHPIVQAGIALGRNYFGSATLSDKVFMHFPTVKMGPGDSARSHTADEYIHLQEIRKGIELYIDLLKSVV
jgi:acetylornithine deacetylase